jgi:hypothetical protein
LRGEGWRLSVLSARTLEEAPPRGKPYFPRRGT